MKININKFMKKNVIFLMIYMMIINYTCEYFHITSTIRYLSDIIVSLLLIHDINKLSLISLNKELKPFLKVIILLFVATFLGYIINFYSPMLYLWGIRNLFRFFITFFSTIILFQISDIKKVNKIINIIFWINIVVVFYQYLVLGYWADRIGGTFRLADKGGNAGLLLLLILENINITSKYLNKEIKLPYFLTIVFLSMVIGAIAELKAFFVIFVLIIFMSLILNKKSFKTIIFTLLTIIALCIGILTLSYIAPRSAETLKLDNMKEYLAGESHGYSSKNDVSRGRAFIQINEWFFKDSLIKKLFGFGLGNCDVSSISFFCSDFYLKYKNLNYIWFMHAMLYIETGFIGYIIYICFFILCIFKYFKLRKIDKDKKSIFNSAIILALVCILLTWYNAALRNDVSYFIYIYLAMPLTCFKEKKE